MKINLFNAFSVILILSGCETETLIPPQVQTFEATDVTFNSAQVGGELIDQGNRPISRKGICWSPATLNTQEEFDYIPITVKNHVIESTDAKQAFTLLMDKLSPNKTYYVRAFAESEAGLVYGKKIKFTTNFETITDIDGNVYRIWKIGQRTWTIDNYNATRLRDGTPIPNRTEASYWLPAAPQEPAMCWYNNDRAKYEKDYGALYNWYVASHPLIAPEGWRVPTWNDYFSLAVYLGAITTDRPYIYPVGGKAKMTGNDFWEPPNTAATNESLFSAKAGGCIWHLGFAELGYAAHFFTASEQDCYGSGAPYGCGKLMHLRNHNDQIYLDGLTYKTSGLSLRLIKNE